MLNKITILKAIVICALIIALQTLYVTATSLQASLIAEGQDVSRLEALSYYMSYFDVWSRMFSAWATNFILSLSSCILLLLWLKK
jgi:hypothetical protein